MTKEELMRKAIELSKENVENGGGPFGAVIATKDGVIIATGVNRVTTSCDPTAHAEVSAIRAAAAAHGNALGFLKLLDGLILTLGVIRVFLLDGLHLGRQTGHLHHALLGLRVQGQQDQLHDDGEQDHGDAVVVGRFIQD